MFRFAQNVCDHFMRGNSLAGLGLTFFFVRNSVQQPQRFIVVPFSVGRPSLGYGEILGNTFVFAFILLFSGLKLLSESFDLSYFLARLLEIPASRRAHCARAVG